MLIEIFLVCDLRLLHLYLCTEVLAPLVVGTQKQFNFSHITAGATAMGKVQYILHSCCFIEKKQETLISSVSNKVI